MTDEPTQRRVIDLSVEVAGTPEEVWEAIATGRGISSWFVPSTVEEREGGATTSRFGEGPEMLIPGRVGMVAGLWAEKFDQIAAFQNFIVMPMTFLSGVFYSINSLPPFWQALSHLNPFFYVIDGFRRGFFGVSDVSPWLSLGVVVGTLAAVCALNVQLLRMGYKIRG